MRLIPKGRKVKREVERRGHSRQGYRDTIIRPKLIVGKVRFEVVDISERGIRFVDSKKIKIQGWVNGTLVFPDNRSIEIDGIVVRRRNDEIGLHLIGPIDLH
jgi:hypothetical protein